MKLGVVAAVAMLVLTGCAQTRISGSQTTGQIERELADAVAANSKQKNTDAVDRAMMPPLALDGLAPVPQAEPARFDLVVNDAPAAQVFLAIVSGSRFSMLVPPEINGRLTLNLKNVNIREALDTIRDLYGYGYAVKGNRILIQPNTLQTRMFKVNYLAGRRVGSSDVRVMSSSMSSSSPQGQSPTAAGQTQPAPGGGAPGGSATQAAERSQVRMTTDQDFWKELSTALVAIVGDSQGAQVVVNAGSGVVLVRAFPAEMKVIEEYLRATQAIVERQVMLEAKIIRVALSERFQSGVNWMAFNGSGNRWGAGSMQPGATLQGEGALINSDVTAYPGRFVEGVSGGAQAKLLGKGFFGLAFQSATFSALMSFLETQGDTQVLSSPRLATLNNQKAVLKVGKDEFYVTNLSTTQSTTAVGATTGASIPNVTLQPFFSGVSLDVTPQIDDDGSIILHIHPSITQVEEVHKTLLVPKNSGSGSSAVTLPTASSSVNESDTIVRVTDGQIVAIGGLMDQIQQKDSDGLAGAVSAPGVGALFGQKSTGFVKTELVILLKPTVIQGDSGWRDDLLETQQRLKNFDPRRNTNNTAE